MRILHVLDHSLPLHSGYVYRTLGIVNQQRALGWEPVLLTSGKHYLPGPEREQIGEWEFLRTPMPSGLAATLLWPPGSGSTGRPSSAFLARSIPMRVWICCCAPCPKCGGSNRQSPCCSPAADRKKTICAPSSASFISATVSSSPVECRITRCGA